MIATCAIALAIALTANPYEETFDRATQAYTNGNFEQAIQMYEQLIAERVTEPAVFYNLGNSYYRVNRIGPAIANYERALHLAPGMESVHKNLQQCIAGSKNQMARPAAPEWHNVFFWHEGVSPRAIRNVSIASWLIFWAALCIRQWRRLPYTRLIAGLACLFAVATMASVWVKANPPQLAVASMDDVSVHYDAGDSQQVYYTLAEGDRVLVMRRDGDWVLVVTANQQRGWARSDAFTFVGPPYTPPPPRKTA